MKLIYNTSSLNIPFKGNFNQASFNRNHGESIWVETNRNGVIGLGEGCPRFYVTGENLPGSLNWLKSIQDEVEKYCTDLPSLIDYVNNNAVIIDKYPSAWCALELALLDLFAREKMMSVEKLLQMPPVTNCIFSYTAVLSDDDTDNFNQKLQRFKKIGFYQYKVKISGDLERDFYKFQILRKELPENGYSLRVDANNLWKDNLTEALNYFNTLQLPLIGIEEPFEKGRFKDISSLSQELNTPVILDESGATKADLTTAVNAMAKVILNIKVSKAGGILRSISLVNLARELGIKVIVGAHVGETSILTRAGMLLANYAGESLIGQEGGFGEHLLQYDYVYPVVQLGKNGVIDLGAEYHYQSTNGIETILPTHWKKGWGLEKKVISRS